jgi:hypothetical protein
MDSLDTEIESLKGAQVRLDAKRSTSSLIGELSARNYARLNLAAPVAKRGSSERSIVQSLLVEFLIDSFRQLLFGQLLFGQLLFGQLFSQLDYCYAISTFVVFSRAILLQGVI